MSDTTYCYPPDYTVLKNKLNLRDAAALERVERRLVVQRAREGMPAGDFDFRHLKAINRHLFQDIYDWAGQVRTVEISKGASQFQFARYIETGMADIHRRIMQSGFLNTRDAGDFAHLAGEIIGDINYVHPFRDGNGRTQLQYLKQVATYAGHVLDLRKLKRREWMHASRAAHHGNYQGLVDAVRSAIVDTKRIS